MKKIILGLLTILTLTLFVGCDKVNNIQIDSEYTNPIGTLKCINTLDELLSDNYEPKFDINNDEYVDGEFPYINMDLPEANDINNLMKAYALITKASTLACDKTYEEFPEHGVEHYLEPTCNVIQNDSYIFIIIKARRSDSWYSNVLAIDVDNNKLLTKEEILALKDYNLEENMESLLDNIFENYYMDNVGSDKEHLEERREAVTNYLLTDIKNNELYFFSQKYDSSIDLKEYGKVKFIEQGSFDYDTRHYEILYDDYNCNFGELKVYPYINEKDNLVIQISNDDFQESMYNMDNEITK